MKYSICMLSLIALRSEQSHRSEMVSQVMFGEVFEILQEEMDWTQVRLLETKYIGWIQNGQFMKLDNSDLAYYLKGKSCMVGREGGLIFQNEKRIHLCHGTKIYLNADSKFNLANFEMSYQGSVNLFSKVDFDSKIGNLALSYKETPYLWGGRSQWGIDCSGFSQLLYSCFDVNLPRDAYQQAEIGETVDFISEIKTGDLAYFDNADGRITHVGIMLDSDTIIHASAKVRIDRMDNEGIFNQELNRYSHKLRIVKRYLNV